MKEEGSLFISVIANFVQPDFYCVCIEWSDLLSFGNFMIWFQPLLWIVNLTQRKLAIELNWWERLRTEELPLKWSVNILNSNIFLIVFCSGVIVAVYNRVISVIVYAFCFAFIEWVQVGWEFDATWESKFSSWRCSGELFNNFVVCVCLHAVRLD